MVGAEALALFVARPWVPTFATAVHKPRDGDLIFRMLFSAMVVELLTSAGCTLTSIYLQFSETH